MGINKEATGGGAAYPRQNVFALAFYKVLRSRNSHQGSPNPILAQRSLFTDSPGLQLAKCHVGLTLQRRMLLSLSSPMITTLCCTAQFQGSTRHSSAHCRAWKEPLEDTGALLKVLFGFQRCIMGVLHQSCTGYAHCPLVV
jgi:hypothetical protein